jgi:hypothetical protein
MKKSGKKPKRKSTPVRRTHKTKDDFMRWLRKRDAHKRQTERTLAKALMVWADDGGAAD